jgi:hypothetical protein
MVNLILRAKRESYGISWMFCDEMWVILEAIWQIFGE